jgi:uncharacterized membrane protein
VSEAGSDEAAKAAKLVYFLYLLSLVTGGITMLIGVVIAYVNRPEAPGWIVDHFTYQIRTFWLGLLYGLIGAALTVVLIGLMLLPVVLVWFIVRCVKGYQWLDRHSSPPDVETWMV